MPGDVTDRHRRLAVAGFAVIYTAYPLSALLHARRGPAFTVAMAAGLAVVLVLFTLQNLADDESIDRGPVPWWQVGTIVALSVTLSVAGGSSWVLTLAFGSATASLRCPPRLATATAVGCFVVSAAVMAAYGEDAGTVVLVSLVPVVIAAFSRNARGRIRATAQLRATRDELARIAVADERLRIARDLHDLLGHSLSLIAVKTELARRVLPTQPDRATRELVEIESVAREALAEVRNAVTGYRRPTVTAELVAARRAVTSAGIACTVDAPADPDLPGEVDALLAWAVREAATNVVRHSRARNCVIRLAAGASTALLEVRDDGVGAGSPSRGMGNGLSGLTERAAVHGGRVSAGTGDGGGFVLSVEVPRGLP